MSDNRKPTPPPEQVPAHETRKIAAVRPPSDARMPAASEEQQLSHPTVVIAKVVALEDVPVLVTMDALEGASSELRMLLAAIDGESNVAQIAEVAGMVPEHAQAMIAALKSEGLVSVISGAAPSNPRGATSIDKAMEDLDRQEREPRPPEYWLGGLKPRTGK